MQLDFDKYHGTGNDFILIDDRSGRFPLDNKALVARLCDRRFGIGADGLILLRMDDSTDFNMVYFNSDGRQSSMCGNGGRCLVAFARSLGIIKDECSFMAIDGLHKASILEDGSVSLKMIDVQDAKLDGSAWVLDTGSPHWVGFMTEMPKDFIKEARIIRNQALYIEKGINVNLVKQTAESEVDIRTYERGVEDETYSCGTGAVAAALAWARQHALDPGRYELKLKTLGGPLKVSFKMDQQMRFTSIYLIGPATMVYSGKIEV